MRPVLFIALLTALVACRGERPPRDYQNSPPTATHPPQTQSQTPSAQGMPAAAPEPSKGAEGANITRQPASAETPTTTVKDTPPATTTT